MDAFGSLRLAAPIMPSLGALHLAANLEKNGYNHVAILKEYMNPDNKRRETTRASRTSTNQIIYGEIRDMMEHQVDLIIDGGYCGLETTTVVSLEEDYPVIVREGMGDTSLFV